MNDVHTLLVTAMNVREATPEQIAAIAALLETAAFSGNGPRPPKENDDEMTTTP